MLGVIMIQKAAEDSKHKFGRIVIILDKGDIFLKYTTGIYAVDCLWCRKK